MSRLPTGVWELILPTRLLMTAVVSFLYSWNSVQELRILSVRLLQGGFY